MEQMARNLTDPGDGFLRASRHLIHDRDPLYTRVFEDILRAAGVNPVRLPARSPDLNAYAERFVRSIKDECLNRVVPLGEGHLRRLVHEYVEHYHRERNHQGVGNQLLRRPPPQLRCGPRRLAGASRRTAQLLLSRGRLIGRPNYLGAKVGVRETHAHEWSAGVTARSDALDLDEGVFTWTDPEKIARSLKRSAEVSTRGKGTPFQSAMSMLTFYINRAGTNLSAEQRRTLQRAKDELREAFGKVYFNIQIPQRTFDAFHERLDQ